MVNTKAITLMSKIIIFYGYFKKEKSEQHANHNNNNN